MTKVNMLEAKTDLSKLIRLLETRQEDVIVISRNGTPVAELKLAQKVPANQRIGAAKGKFAIPDDFDQWDKEIEDMFEVLR